MKSSNLNTPLDDVEFLARADHRVMALAALARRPQSRTDLRTMTGVSQSTVGRTLRAFEERNWIRRDGGHYEATELGRFVAVAMRELVDRLAVEQTLRDVWRWLPDEDSGFTIEMVADAVVTVAETDDPYRPVNRFKTLLGAADRFRFVGFDIALLEPCRDELCRRIFEGMRTELVNPPSVVEHIRTAYPDCFAEALESGNLTLWLHDDLPPYGVGILDDRTVISGYHPANGTVEVLIDTDAPAAREWAEGIYETYRRELPTLALTPSERQTTRTP